MYYMHINKRIKKYQQEVQRLKTKRHTLYQIKKQKRELDGSIRNLKIKLRSSHSNFIAQEKQLPQKQMILIAQEAQKSGLTLESCIAQKEKNKQWFSKQNITYNIKGQTEGVLHFINKIKKIAHSLKCKKLAFQKNGKTISHLECVLQLINFHSRYNRS